MSYKQYKSRYNEINKFYRNWKFGMPQMTPWKPTKSRRKIGKADYALQLARQAMRGKEWKHLDKYASLSCGIAGNFYLLTDIDQDDSKNGRDGDEIVTRSVWVRGKVAIHASSATTNLRVIIFLDKYSSNVAADPATGDLLDTTIGTPQFNFRELDNKKRFRILNDNTYCLSQNGPQVAFINIYRQFKMLKTLYNNAVATSGRVANHVYLFLISNEPTNTPAVTWMARVRFTDS